MAANSTAATPASFAMPANEIMHPLKIYRRPYRAVLLNKYVIG
jgi:hypothetical protein